MAKGMKGTEWLGSISGNELADVLIGAASRSDGCMEALLSEAAIRLRMAMSEPVPCEPLTADEIEDLGSKAVGFDTRGFTPCTTDRAYGECDDPDCLCHERYGAQPPEETMDADELQPMPIDWTTIWGIEQYIKDEIEGLRQELLGAKSRIYVLEQNAKSAAMAPASSSTQHMINTALEALGSGIWVLNNKHNRNTDKWLVYALAAEEDMRKAVKEIEQQVVLLQTDDGEDELVDLSDQPVSRPGDVFPVHRGAHTRMQESIHTAKAWVDHLSNLAEQEKQDECCSKTPAEEATQLPSVDDAIDNIQRQVYTLRIDLQHQIDALRLVTGIKVDEAKEINERINSLQLKIHGMEMDREEAAKALQWSIYADELKKFAKVLDERLDDLQAQVTLLQMDVIELEHADKTCCSEPEDECKLSKLAMALMNTPPADVSSCVRSSHIPGMVQITIPSVKELLEPWGYKLYGGVWQQPSKAKIGDPFDNPSKEEEQDGA